MRGTWQTTSGGGIDLGPVALVIGAVIAAPSIAAAVIALANALAVIAICAAVVVVAAVVGLVALLWHRARHPAPPRALPWQPGVLAAERARNHPELAAAPRAAIEAPQQMHLHFHGVHPGDVPELISRHQEGHRL